MLKKVRRNLLSYSKAFQFATPVVSKANGPIVVRFHSDSKYHTVLKQGFRIKYEQSSTGCAVLNAGYANPQNVINFQSGNANAGPIVALPVESGKKPQIPVQPNPGNSFNWDDDGLKSRNSATTPTIEKPSRSNRSRSRANHKFMFY